MLFFIIDNYLNKKTFKKYLYAILKTNKTATLGSFVRDILQSKLFKMMSEMLSLEAFHHFFI